MSADPKELIADLCVVIAQAVEHLSIPSPKTRAAIEEELHRIGRAAWGLDDE